MRTRAFAIGSIALALAGCVSLEFPAFGSWGGGSMSHGGQTGNLRTNYALVHLTHEARVYFVMLVDGASGGRVSSGASGANGEFPVRDGKAQWDVSTRNARTGRVTIAGQSFKLEEGAAFLVNAHAETVSATQVKIDLAVFNEGNWSPDDRVRRLAVSDERIAAFLKRCETPK
jgi:hypothetical protein